jgi:hypothetical protein
MGQQDDIDAPAFLFDIGDGSNVFGLVALFKEHDEMLVMNMGRTNRGRISVVVGALYQTTRYILQSFNTLLILA